VGTWEKRLTKHHASVDMPENPEKPLESMTLGTRLMTMEIIRQPIAINGRHVR
jgi:hypothetical protein